MTYQNSRIPTVTCQIIKIPTMKYQNIEIQTATYMHQNIKIFTMTNKNMVAFIIKKKAWISSQIPHEVFLIQTSIGIYNIIIGALFRHTHMYVFFLLMQQLPYCVLSWLKQIFKTCAFCFVLQYFKKDKTSIHNDYL